MSVARRAAASASSCPMPRARPGRAGTRSWPMSTSTTTPWTPQARLCRHLRPARVRRRRPQADLQPPRHILIYSAAAGGYVPAYAIPAGQNGSKPEAQRLRGGAPGTSATIAGARACCPTRAVSTCAVPPQSAQDYPLNFTPHGLVQAHIDARGVQTISLLNGPRSHLLATFNAQLANIDLPSAQPISHPGADGKTLTSWLYLPAGPQDRRALAPDRDVLSRCRRAPSLPVGGRPDLKNSMTNQNVTLGKGSRGAGRQLCQVALLPRPGRRLPARPSSMRSTRPPPPARSIPSASPSGVIALAATPPW